MIFEYEMACQKAYREEAHIIEAIEAHAALYYEEDARTSWAEEEYLYECYEDQWALEEELEYYTDITKMEKDIEDDHAMSVEEEMMDREGWQQITLDAAEIRHFIKLAEKTAHEVFLDAQCEVEDRFIKATGEAEARYYEALEKARVRYEAETKGIGQQKRAAELDEAEEDNGRVEKKAKVEEEESQVEAEVEIDVEAAAVEDDQAELAGAGIQPKDELVRAGVHAKQDASVDEGFFERGSSQEWEQVEDLSLDPATWKEAWAAGFGEALMGEVVEIHV